MDSSIAAIFTRLAQKDHKNQDQQENLHLFFGISSFLTTRENLDHILNEKYSSILYEIISY
jgi:hypothetical protein